MNRKVDFQFALFSKLFSIKIVFKSFQIFLKSRLIFLTTSKLNAENLIAQGLVPDIREIVLLRDRFF